MSLGTPNFVRRSLSRLSVVALLGGSLLTACGNGTSGSSGTAGIPGTEVAKPGSTDTFFVDENESGRTRRLRIAEVTWGRLVNVHAIDAGGDVVQTPVFRNFVIGQDIQSDLVNYRLESNPVTHQDRLVVLRERDAADFISLVQSAGSATTPLEPKNDDGTSAGPFPFLARNAALSVRFSDVLDDSALAEANLGENVRVLTNYPPSIPYQARILFDPNHGALIGGAFHSSRVIVDLTVSEAEAASMLTPLPVNAIGLNASSLVSGDPNVSIRIPTTIATGSGQFSRLESLSGVALDVASNGPSANNSTFDVVRAFRGGNSNDANNGFLRDVVAPEVLGAWQLTGLTAINAPAGELGFDFVLDVNFPTVCQDVLSEGDVLALGPHFLEVTATTAAPDGSGTIIGVEARNVSETAITFLGTLTGSGQLLKTLDLASPVPEGCWINFTPSPTGEPATNMPITGVSTTAVASVRFTEPMDPSTMTALDTFSVVSGPTSADVTALNTVVGIVQAGPDLDSFSFIQALPFSHENGMTESYHVLFQRAPKDLSGNDLATLPPRIGFELEATDPTDVNAGVTFTFSSLDTLGWDDGAEVFAGVPDGRIDVRGQVFVDESRGVLRPRSVQHATYAADRSKPVPSLMSLSPTGTGVREPLVALGSRLQTVWRYCDFGWFAGDETKFNLDVIGLSWAPIGGNVIGDFFEEFEILLGHSSRLPDEGAAGAGVSLTSGLLGAPSLFADNLLEDPDSPARIVHPRSLGYEISAIDLFTAPTGTTMMPFPYNRAGAPPTSFLWRDTGAVGIGDADLTTDGGIPLDVETEAAIDSVEKWIANGQPMTTMALPLLMEFRCFPSSTGVGLNTLDISVPGGLFTGVAPNFRVWSSGGTDTSGTPVRKNPDQETGPTGGFNDGIYDPFSPVGAATVDADGVFYIGAIDTVVRVSRALLCWVDTDTNANLGVDWEDPIIEPDPSTFPEGTALQLDYRGGASFSGLAAAPSFIPFDAASLDWYGLIRRTKVGGPGGITDFFDSGDDTWYAEISDVNGARYLQTRLTFINNVDSGLSLELSALGFPYTENE